MEEYQIGKDMAELKLRVMEMESVVQAMSSVIQLNIKHGKISGELQKD